MCADVHHQFTEAFRRAAGPATLNVRYCPLAEIENEIASRYG
jgi:hypothetical protein